MSATYSNINSLPLYGVKKAQNEKPDQRHYSAMRYVPLSPPGPHVRATVLRGANDRLEDLAVVHLRRRAVAGSNQLGVGVHIDMVLVTVMVLTILLRPSP